MVSLGLEAELNPGKLFQVKMLIKWFVVCSDFNHIKEKQTKKTREFCRVNTGAYSKMLIVVEVRRVRVIFFLFLHFHIFFNKQDRL